MDKTALFKLSYGLYVIGVQDGNGLGGCVVDAFMQATDSPPTALLCNGIRTRTNELIKQTGECTVSVLPANVDPLVIATFGFQSARAADKWAGMEYTLHDGLPVLHCACAGLRLQLTDQRELGSHTLFFFDVVDAWPGEGEPLLYNEYQKSMKPATMAAFQAMKSGK